MGSSAGQAKHIPERTCIACRSKKPKWELVRVVRTPQGVVEIDGRGKKAGRGAYLCRERKCWDIGLKKRKLGHALNTDIGPAELAQLEEYAKGMKATVGLGGSV